MIISQYYNNNNKLQQTLPNTLNMKNAFEINIKSDVAINSLYVRINVMYWYVNNPKLLAS